MKNKGENGVGRISVEFEVANCSDMIKVEEGSLSPDKVRRQRITGIVDSGATKLVLPQAVAKQLGLPSANMINVQYADGRRVQRPQAKLAYIELNGRNGIFTAIFE